MYTGPSPRNLGLSVLLHGAAITALVTLSVPSPPPEVNAATVGPTEIRISGKLYYVSRIEGSSSAGSHSDASRSQASPTPSPTAGKAGGITAPRAREAGRSPAPAPERVAAAAPTPPPTPVPASASDPAPAPLPDKIRALRQQARAFIAPEVHPRPTATQTLIQPLSPPDLVPPPTPLPNFRVLTEVSQMRKIPKPFEAPGRRTPPTPPQSPVVATPPALALVPLAPAPVGDPLAVLSINDHPIPFNEKVVVPAGNIAQPLLESTGPAGVAGSAPSNNAGSGASRDAGGAGKAAGTSGTAGNAASASTGGNGNATGSAPGNGRAAIGSGTGAALVGGSKEGSPVAVVGGNGGSPGDTGVKGAGSGTTGSGASNADAAGSGGTSDTAGLGAGSGVGNGAGSGAGSGKATPGSTVINRPATGNFDAVVVQSSPVDQYPESRGLLSGRPIYSVYIPMGTARDWTLFFCVPGEKPESTNSPVVRLTPLGAPVKAPYPTKLVKPAITLPSYEKYILVHGTVNQEGKFESLRLVRSIKPETDQALLVALAAWEFRAATRDGVAIAVEFLLSIPAKGL